MNSTYLHIATPDSAYQIPAQWWYVILGICIGSILLTVILANRPLMPALMATLTAGICSGTAPRAVYYDIILDTAGDPVLLTYQAVPVWLWYVSGLLLAISVILIVGGIYYIPRSAAAEGGYWK